MFAYRELQSQALVRGTRNDAVRDMRHNASVSDARFFLREWRIFRGLTQQQLADKLGTSKGYLSDLERGLRRYNQDLLEKAAEELQCKPADLISRDPSDPPSQSAEIITMLDRIPARNQDIAKRMLRSLAEDGDD